METDENCVPLQEVIETTQVITHQHSSQVGTKKLMYKTVSCTRTTGKYVLSADGWVSEIY